MSVTIPGTRKSLGFSGPQFPHMHVGWIPSPAALTTSSPRPRGPTVPPPPGGGSKRRGQGDVVEEIEAEGQEEHVLGELLPLHMQQRVRGSRVNISCRFWEGSTGHHGDEREEGPFSRALISKELWSQQCPGRRGQ